MEWWKEGNLDRLFGEAKAIQTELAKAPPSNRNPLKTFANLALQGRMAAALRVLTESQNSGPLEPDERVMRKLTELHPQRKK